VGLGIDGARPTRAPNEKIIVDLETADKQVVPQRTWTQFEPIKNLPTDGSKIVDKDGNQLMTVGHHFELSPAFAKEEMGCC